MTRAYRRYDPRLKNLVIPKSTLREWIRNRYQEYFTLPELAQDSAELVARNLELKAQNEAIRAKQTLLTKTIRIFGFQMARATLSSG